MEPFATALTATAIANLTFELFIKPATGELAKKFTDGAIQKMGDLWNLIKTRLAGKKENLDEALQKVEEGDQTALNTVSKYLDIEMEEDSGFANTLRLLAQEINAGKLQDNSSMSQNNYDSSTGYQTKVEGSGPTFVGGVHHHGQGH